MALVDQFKTTRMPQKPRQPGNLLGARPMPGQATGNALPSFLPSGPMRPVSEAAPGEAAPSKAQPVAPQKPVGRAPSQAEVLAARTPAPKPPLQRLYEFMKTDLQREQEKGLADWRTNMASRGLFYGTAGVPGEGEIQERYFRGLGQLESDLIQRETGNELARLQLATGLIPQDIEGGSGFLSPDLIAALGGLFAGQQPRKKPALIESPGES